MGGHVPPLFSVLVGLVSTEDRGRIFETLAALRLQSGARTWEVILADRCNDAVADRIRIEFPEAAIIASDAHASLPELRTRALERATGRYVAVTEDHCVPAVDWLDAMARAFERAPPGTVAVGGCVANGVTDTALDWATFLCEYAALAPPVGEGPAETLPGMNVAYDAAALRAFDTGFLRAAFWESSVHPRMRAAGQGLYATDAIALRHCKRFTLGLFIRQRYAYSRQFAGARFPRGAWVRRVLALAATPLLPPLLLLRVTRDALRKDPLRAALPRALPYLALFVLVWAWGEAVGYAFGAGDCLERIE